MIDLIHPDQPRRQLEHIIPEGNNNKLSILGALLDIRRDDGDIPEIQRGIDLIHDVQRGGLIMMESEHQRERGQRLLASRKVADILPALLGRHDGE